MGRNGPLGLLLGFVICGLVVWGFIHILDPHTAPPSRSYALSRVTVIRGTFCPSDVRLPTWTAQNQVVKLALPIGPYPGTAYRGPGLESEYTWSEDNWTIDIGGPVGMNFGVTQVAVELANAHLPGVGVLAWYDSDRTHLWTTLVVWKVSGLCYNLRVHTNPQETRALISLLDAWRAHPAFHYSCRAGKVGIWSCVPLIFHNTH
jgi:hypothetical protein